MLRIGKKSLFLPIGFSLMNVDSGIPCHLSDSTPEGTRTSCEVQVNADRNGSVCPYYLGRLLGTAKQRWLNSEKWL